MIRGVASSFLKVPFRSFSQKSTEFIKGNISEFSNLFSLYNEELKKGGTRYTLRITKPHTGTTRVETHDLQPQDLEILTGKISSLLKTNGTKITVIFHSSSEEEKKS